MQGEHGVGVPGTERAPFVRVAGLQQHRMTLRSRRQRREPAHAELRSQVLDAVDSVRIDIDPGLQVGKHGVGGPAIPESPGHRHEFLGPRVPIGIVEKSAAPEVGTCEGVR